MREADIAAAASGEGTNSSGGKGSPQPVARKSFTGIVILKIAHSTTAEMRC
jgi:hypothetical protein